MRCTISWPILLLMAFPHQLATAGLPTAVETFLKQNCHQCHDADSQEGGLDLTRLVLDPAKPEALAQWVRVYDRVQGGEMPPQKEPRPEQQVQKAFLASL